MTNPSPTHEDFDQECKICGTKWSGNEKLPCPTPGKHNWEKKFDENILALDRKTDFDGHWKKRTAFGYKTEIDWEAIKSYISSLLADEERKVRERLRDWVEMMWSFDEFDHDDWTGSDEVLASIQNYLEGKHK